MADNVPLTPGSGFNAAADEVTYSGDTAQDQLVRPTHVAGAEGAKTVEAITQTTGSAVPPAVLFVGGTDGTNTRALKVDAGGELQIDVLSSALPTGAATLAEQQTQTTALQLIDDTIGATGAAIPAKGSAAMGTDGTNGHILKTDAGGVLQVFGSFITASTDVTRPADTTAYAVNDALSDSTSAPTSGGFTFSAMGRASGGSGIITDAIITSSNDPATTLQGEIWLFNTSVTNINDNTAFAVSDAEIKTCVGKIPFTMEDAGNNQFFNATNLNIGYTCSGSDDLRFLIRVKNGYTPASAEVLTFVVKAVRVD